MIIEEGLSLQEEVDELESVWIRRAGNIECLVVDIHEIIGRELQHVPFSCALRRIHISRIVVVLLRAFEGFLEGPVQSVLLLVGESVPIESLKELWVACQVRDITLHKRLAAIPLITCVCMPLSDGYAVDDSLRGDVLFAEGLLLWLEARAQLAEVEL